MRQFGNHTIRLLIIKFQQNNEKKTTTTVICLHCLGCNLNVIYAAQFATIANQIHALNNLEQAEAQ